MKGGDHEVAYCIHWQVLIGCRNCVKLALKNGGVNPFFYANKKRPVMALSFVSKLSAL